MLGAADKPWLVADEEDRLSRVQPRILRDQGDERAELAERKPVVPVFADRAVNPAAVASVIRYRGRLAACRPYCGERNREDGTASVIVGHFPNKEVLAAGTICGVNFE
jgi:hypothetical protein